MSVYDGEEEPTCEVVIAHDFEDRSRHGKTVALPLSEARAMVRDGRARYADEPQPAQPDWYRRANEVRKATPPPQPSPEPAAEPPADTPSQDAASDTVPQEPAPHRTRGTKKD